MNSAGDVAPNLDGRIPRPVILAALLLGLLTVALFARTWNHQMLYWDDDVNVLQNPLVVMPLGAGLKEIFTRPFSTDYYPLTYISLAVDHWVWGGRFFGYHVTQTLLHGLNAFLVVLLVWRWTKTTAVAVLAGAWFAWHPVQVETVAWIAERKNVLGACFFLLAWLAYLRSEDADGKTAAAWGHAAYNGKDGIPPNCTTTKAGGWRLTALTLFVLAVLSHALVIIFPALLLIYEICLRRQRIAGALGRTWLFFVPAAFAAALRVLGHARSGQLISPFRNSTEWFLTMAKVVGEYVTTLFWPVHLSNHYTVTANDSWVSPALLVTLGWLMAWLLVAMICPSLRRWCIFALGWFLICLSPVLEIVPHPTLRADRYLYLAGLGVFLLVAMALNRKRALLVVAGPLSGACLIGLTMMRIPVWHDPKSLWTDCVRKNPRSVVGYYSLSGAAILEHDWPAAAGYVKKAIDLKPDFAEAHARLGEIYGMENMPAQAHEELQRALALNPELTEARQNLMLLEQRHP